MASCRNEGCTRPPLEERVYCSDACADESIERGLRLCGQRTQATLGYAAQRRALIDRRKTRG